MAHRERLPLGQQGGAGGVGLQGAAGLEVTLHPGQPQQQGVEGLVELLGEGGRRSWEGGGYGREGGGHGREGGGHGRVEVIEGNSK